MLCMRAVVAVALLWTRGVCLWDRCAVGRHGSHSAHSKSIVLLVQTSCLDRTPCEDESVHGGKSWGSDENVQLVCFRNRRDRRVELSIY